jgi:hypothetical protein
MTVATKRYSVRERIPQRVHTTDARSRDVWITPPTAAESAANQRRTGAVAWLNLGLVWQGDLKPVGEAVARVIDALRRVKDKARQRDALSAAAVEIANYGNDLGTSEAGRGPAGSLAFNGSVDERRGEREEDIDGHVLDSSATPQSIQRANDQYWADRLGRSQAMDHAGRGLSTRATPDSINAANRAFYATQPTARREWGKG